jgi:hypothetical protein
MHETSMESCIGKGIRGPEPISVEIEEMIQLELMAENVWLRPSQGSLNHE